MNEQEKAYIRGVADALEKIHEALVGLDDQIECLLADIAIADQGFMSLQEFLDRGDKGECPN